MDRRVVRRALLPWARLLLPTRCFVCSELLGAWQTRGACANCWADLRVIPASACSRCALPWDGTSDLPGGETKSCASCASDPPVVDRVAAAVVYDRVASRLLLRAKRGGRPELLDPLGDLLAAALRARWPELGRKPIVVVPVPSHPWSSLRRGFAPASRLARRLSRRLGLPAPVHALVRPWLSRIDSRGLGRIGRARTAATPKVTKSVSGEEVLLIDDVMTTGSTVEACAAALRAAGAPRVRAAVWARALPRREETLTGQRRHRISRLEPGLAARPGHAAADVSSQRRF